MHDLHNVQQHQQPQRNLQQQQQQQRYHQEPPRRPQGHSLHHRPDVPPGSMTAPTPTQSYIVQYPGFSGSPPHSVPYPTASSPEGGYTFADQRQEWGPYAYHPQNGYGYEPSSIYYPDPSSVPHPAQVSPSLVSPPMQGCIAHHPDQHTSYPQSWETSRYASVPAIRPSHSPPRSPAEERNHGPFQPWSAPARPSPPVRIGPHPDSGFRHVADDPAEPTSAAVEVQGSTYATSPAIGTVVLHHDTPHSPFLPHPPSVTCTPAFATPQGSSQALATSRALQQTMQQPTPEQQPSFHHPYFPDHLSARHLGCGTTSLPSTQQGVSATSATGSRLPSNSHHLLNSPEGRKAVAVAMASKPSPASDPDAEGSDDEDADAEGEADDSVDDQRHRVFPPAGQPISASAAETSIATPAPAGSVSPRGRNDAAHVLLSLARSDSSNGGTVQSEGTSPATHGMALRSGRRGGRSSVSPSRTGKGKNEGAAVELAPAVVLEGPMEMKRYHTRSQPEQLDDQSPHGSIPSGRVLLAEASPLDPRSNTASPVTELRSRGHLLPHPTLLPATPGSAGSQRPLPSLPSLGLASPSGLVPGAGPSTSVIHHLASGVPGAGRRKGKHRASDSFTATTGTATTTTNTANGADDDSRSSYSVSTPGTSTSGQQSAYASRRTFPPQIPVDANLPRLYRNFPVPSAFGDREPVRTLAAQHGIPLLTAPPEGLFNTPAHGHLDLYTPRYVRGVGSEKVGACCICAEPRERGGEDTLLWLKMKVSSYSYHLSFYHGINNVNGLPFSPPVDIRQVKRSKVAANEKTVMREGQCHQCLKWVPLEGVKNSEVKVPELFWWKHAKACHKTRLMGEGNVHAPDDIYDLVSSAAYYGPGSFQLQQGVAGVALPRNSPAGTPTGTPNPGAASPIVGLQPGAVLVPSQQPVPHYAYPLLPPHPHHHPLGQPQVQGSTLPSPALTAVSHGSSGSYFVQPPAASSTPKVHPSVGAQRAAAQRAWKRKSDAAELQQGLSPASKKARRPTTAAQVVAEGKEGA